MNKITQNSLVVIIAIIILFATALIEWNIYSWFILLGTIILIFVWYFKK